MITRAKELGMAGIAITDHGPLLEPHISGPFFDRLWNPVEGIRFMKGMECNPDGEDGKIDLPPERLQYLDVVILGLHYSIPTGLDKERNTSILVRAIEKNPCIDIIAHPNDLNYRVNFSRLAAVAREHGVALELNNSKTALQRVPDGITRELIETCKNEECNIAIGSDAHAVNELGRDDAVRPLLDECGFPEELIVNSSAEKGFSFVDSRAVNKQG